MGLFSGDAFAGIVCFFEFVILAYFIFSAFKQKRWDNYLLPIGGIVLITPLLWDLHNEKQFIITLIIFISLLISTVLVNYIRKAAIH